MGELQAKIDFFGPGSNMETRFIHDYDKLVEILMYIRKLRPDIKIVLIMGSWDVLHVGHSRYIEAGSKYGDIVIIGVDSDEKTRRRKGPNRPVVPQDERIEQLCHLRHVDLVVLKEPDHPKWHLIKTVRPDVLITIEENYTDEEREQLKEFCGKVETLPRQAETSTSAKVRRLVLDFSEKATKAATEAIQHNAKVLAEDVAKRIEQELDNA